MVKQCGVVSVESLKAIHKQPAIIIDSHSVVEIQFLFVFLIAGPRAAKTWSNHSSL